MPQRPTGLRIVQIKNQAQGSKDLNDEWVRIVNVGPQRWDIRGWLLTDETDQQKEPHIYTFPDRVGNRDVWHFDPGQTIYVRTGKGTDAFFPNSNPPQYHFYWGRLSFVWNNSGDRVYLRHPNGTFATEPFPVP